MGGVEGIRGVAVVEEVGTKEKKLSVMKPCAILTICYVDYI